MTDFDAVLKRHNRWCLSYQGFIDRFASRGQAVKALTDLEAPDTEVEVNKKGEVALVRKVQTEYGPGKQYICAANPW